MPDGGTTHSGAENVSSGDFADALKGAKTPDYVKPAAPQNKPTEGEVFSAPPLTIDDLDQLQSKLEATVKGFDLLRDDQVKAATTLTVEASQTDKQTQEQAAARQAEETERTRAALESAQKAAALAKSMVQEAQEHQEQNRQEMDEQRKKAEAEIERLRSELNKVSLVADNSRFQAQRQNLIGDFVDRYGRQPDPQELQTIERQAGQISPASSSNRAWVAPGHSQAPLESTATITTYGPAELESERRTRERNGLPDFTDYRLGQTPVPDSGQRSPGALQRGIDAVMRPQETGAAVKQAAESAKRALAERVREEKERAQRLNDLRVFYNSGLLDDSEGFDRYLRELAQDTVVDPTGRVVFERSFTPFDAQALRMLRNVVGTVDHPSPLNPQGRYSEVSQNGFSPQAMQEEENRLRQESVDRDAPAWKVYRAVNPNAAEDEIDDLVRQDKIADLRGAVQAVSPHQGNPVVAGQTVTPSTQPTRVNVRTLTANELERINETISRLTEIETTRRHVSDGKLLRGRVSSQNAERRKVVNEQIEEEKKKQKLEEEKKAADKKAADAAEKERLEAERLDEIFTELIQTRGLGSVGIQNIYRAARRAAATGDPSGLDRLGINQNDLRQALERHRGTLDEDNEELLENLDVLLSRGVPNNSRRNRPAIIGPVMALNPQEQAALDAAIALGDKGKARGDKAKAAKKTTSYLLGKDWEAFTTGFGELFAIPGALIELIRKILGAP